MRTIRCWQLRSWLTGYVDDELSGRERLIVEDHLRQCRACRLRVNREGAVCRRLQDWSAEARAQGRPLSWPGALERRRQAGVGGLLGVAALLAVMVVIGFVTWHRAELEPGVSLTARGLIADSRCADGHVHSAAKLKNLSNSDCVRRCVENGAQYVFVSDGVVHPIRNQDFVDLARFAGQDVELEGEMRQRLLTVSRVRPLTVSRATMNVLPRCERSR